MAFDRNRDWNYREDCGCTVSFVAASGFKSSRMLPGANCKEHGKFAQMGNRDQLVHRAKASLREAMQG